MQHAEPMTLGELITVLSRKDPEAQIRYDFVYFAPDGIHSYRGDYSQLAMGYAKRDTTVGEVLALLKDAVGKVFTGYKGGDYTMHSGTPVWVAEHNEAGRTAIVDVTDDDGVILRTRMLG